MFATANLAVPVSGLILTEGQDIGWFSRKEIVERQFYTQQIKKNFLFLMLGQNLM